MSFVERYFPYFKTTFSMSECESVQILKEIMTERRLHRIFAETELNTSLHDYEQNHLILNQQLIQHIFLELANPTYKDLQEKARRPLSIIPIQEMDTLYRELIPFEAVQDIFFNRIPENRSYDFVKTSGKGINGLRERVKILQDNFTYHRETHTDQEFFLYETELLTSRLGDREPPASTLVRLKDGYYFYEKTFGKNGGYYSLIRPVTNAPHANFVCRGTAVRPKATGGFLSGVNNLCLEPGMLAIQSTWPSIKEYLQQSGITQIDVYGKSQGGAHAQYLTPLIEKVSRIRVRSLNTLASVGAGSAQEVFYEAFGSRELIDPITVNIIVNDGELTQNEQDFIPWVGGTHVALQRTNSQATRIYSLYSRQSQPAAQEEIHALPSYLKLWRFIRSFGKAHSRQTTLMNYECRHLSSLHRTTEIESMRLLLAKILHIATLGLINPIPYAQFFSQECGQQLA